MSVVNELSNMFFFLRPTKMEQQGDMITVIYKHMSFKDTRILSERDHRTFMTDMREDSVRLLNRLLREFTETQELPT